MEKSPAPDLKDILKVLQEEQHISSKKLQQKVEDILRQIPKISLLEAKSLAKQVLAHCLEIKQIDILLDKSLADISPTQWEELTQVLCRLLAAEPLQYIIGEVQFYHNVYLRLSSAVLIPRPETEEIIDYILKKHQQNPPQRVLDIGTGSACIAITLAKHFPNAVVWALDISEDALEVAQQNALQNQVEIQFRQADMLHLDTSDFPEFEMIVSNPPYVTEAEKEAMHTNVLQYEPHLALFVPNQNPLIFYKAIVAFAQKKLLHKGCIYLEINELFGYEMNLLLQSYSFTDIRLHQDMQGKDRFVSATYLHSSTGFQSPQP